MAELNIVTIPLEEYVELRRKAEETDFIRERIDLVNRNFDELFNKMNNIEMKVGSWLNG